MAQTRFRRCWGLGVILLLLAGLFLPAQERPRVTRNAPSPSLAGLAPVPGARPRNVLFILTDDHRYDAFGFLGHPFLQTPHLDALARNGIHFQNAFVTTSLCSPSRASILTSLYAHQHRVVDNNHPLPPGTVTFPEYLQRARYQTALIGKWHMGGDSDEPRPGFDRWVSFRGQGSYLPNKNGLNVDGKRVAQRGYITDELTDYALDWLRHRDKERPFFLYLAHKAVHAEFIPAPRHRGLYQNKTVIPPPTQADTPANYEGKPMWVRNQRNSWHGVDFPYHSSLDVAAYYRRYCETLLAVDDSVGRLLDYLQQEGLLASTLILYMGDNGFMFGEHGLIDKRTAYEESMRVPMLLHCPELTGPGRALPQLVANIDVAPTVLDAAALVPPAGMVGRSFLPLATGRSIPWRDSLLYEYFWERNYPQTPTMHALRGERYKYIHYYGIWDTDELYDLADDPRETRNLVRSPAHERTVLDFNRRLFATLADTGGMQIPLSPDVGQPANLRRRGGAPAADFPPYLLRNRSGKD
jgi:N-acetylglucosamine-6-sulfatase